MKKQAKKEEVVSHKHVAKLVKRMDKMEKSHAKQSESLKAAQKLIGQKRLPTNKVGKDSKYEKESLQGNKSGKKFAKVSEKKAY